MKRSQLTEGAGIPLVTEPAPANVRDHTLLPPTLDAYAGLEKQTAPLHGKTQSHRPLLPRSGLRDHHCALPDPTGLDPLPMGHPPPHTTHPMTYWRTL